MPSPRELLEDLPRLGWVADPSPVQDLAFLGDQLGMAWLGVKRDDRLGALFGGSKVRKLDYLLAADPWSSAEAWTSAGAMGSGHLVALIAAGKALGREVHARLFWEPPSEGVLENLAYIASEAASVAFTPGRVSTMLAHPSLLLGGTVGGASVVPPGATGPEGMLGAVRAGLELADQVAAGELPEPDVVYLPWGTGGTATGLSVGLALGGLATRVQPVAAVERALATAWQVARLRGSLLTYLRTAGIDVSGPSALLPLDHGHVGPGYGHPTPASEAAVSRLAEHSVALERVYSGKAMAAVLAADGLAGRRVLFWVTPRTRALPSRDGWRDRLPGSLRVRLEGGTSRRNVLVGVAAALGVVAAGGLRVSGYRRFADWDGEVLAPWEAEVVAAAAEALLPGGPGPTPEEVAENVDRYLVGMPEAMLLEIHGLMGLIEHGTGLGCAVRRFTSLAPADRVRFLDSLRGFPGPVPAVPRGIRDLVLLGFYQDPRTWPRLGYSGPLVPDRSTAGRPGRASRTYGWMQAPAGAAPRGVVG